MFALETIIRDSGAYSDACGRNQNMDGALTLELGMRPNIVGGMWLGAVCDGTSDSDGKRAARVALRSVCADAGELLAELPRLRERLDRLMSDAATPTPVLMERAREQLCTRLLPMLRYFIQNAHNQILLNGLDAAATITVAVVYGGYLFTANLGDSPAFLLRREEGGVACVPMYTRHHDGRGITRWIGGKAQLTEGDIPVFCQRLSQNSLVVLGSDGALPAMLEPDLASALDSRDSFNQQCAFLLQRGRALGETDNFTYLSARTVLQAE